MPFAFSRSITIDPAKCGGGNSTNFPVLISGTYAYLATVPNGGKVQNANGYDLGYYADAALATKLAWEVAKYVAATGEIVIWVKVPTLTAPSTPTVIYEAYGDASITTDQSNPTGVWDSNFKGVYHLNDASSPALDSTSNARSGTQSGGVTFGSTGQVGLAVSMAAASSQRIDLGQLSLTGAKTIESWVKFTTLSGYHTTIGSYDAAGGQAQYDFSVNGSKQLEYTVDGTTGYKIWDSAINAVATGTWYHIAITDDGTLTDAGVKIYLNASSQSLTPTSSGTPNIPTTSLGNTALGRSGSFNGNYLNGLLDEARISSSVRDANWILASYNNQLNPSTFYTVGSEVAAGAGVAEGSATAADTPSATVTFAASVAEGSATAADTPSATVIPFGIQFVQRTSVQASDALAFTLPVTSGNLLVAIPSGDSAVAVGVGSNRSGAFAKAVSATTQYTPSLWYAKATSSGTCTVTVTPTIGTFHLAIFELTGQHPTTPLDVADVVQNTTANPSITKATLTDRDAVVAFLSHDGGVASGVTAGYTLNTQSDAPNSIYSSDAYKVDVGTAGNKTVTFTAGATSFSWGLLFAAFKPVASSTYSVSTAEGSATAADTPSAKATFAPSVAEGSATAADAPSAQVTFAASAAEGSTTAADTTTAGTTKAASTAEGSATAADAQSSTVTFAASVAEGAATAADAPSVTVTFATAVAEGAATATDTPSVTRSTPASIAEGSASASDVIAAGTTTPASVVEGSATASDTPSVTRETPAAVAEGAATAADTPSATVTFAASAAEGNATASDTPSAIRSTPASATEGSATAADAQSATITVAAGVAEGSATAIDTPSATATFAASVGEGSDTAIATQDSAGASDGVVAEGGVTATDVVASTAVFAASVAESGAATDVVSASASVSAAVAEGGSTATDAPSAIAVLQGSIAEGAATAQDAVAVAVIWAAAVAEGGNTAQDVQSAGLGEEDAVAEGGNTATDATNASLVASAAVTEGGSTAADSCGAWVVYAGSIAEGTASAQDVTTAQAVWAAFVAESGVLVDTATADIRAPFEPTRVCVSDRSRGLELVDDAIDLALTDRARGLGVADGSRGLTVADRSRSVTLSDSKLTCP